MKKEQKQMSVFGHYKKALGKKHSVAFLFVACIFGLGVVVGGIILPNFYKNLIDAITTGSSYEIIVGILLSIFGLGLLQVLFYRGFEYFDSKLISKAYVKNGDYGLRLLSSHSYQFFTNNFAGSLVTKFKRFVRSVDDLFSFIVRDFLFAFLNVIGILVLFFINNIFLGLVALFWFIVFFSVMLYATIKRIPLERESSRMDSKVTGVLSDIVSNVINLKLFSSQTQEEKNFHNLLTEDHTIRIRNWGYANKTYTVQATVSILAQSSLIFLSVWLWNQELITTGTIVLTISYATTLFNRLGGLGSAIRRFTDAYTNAKEFTDILNESIEITDPQSPEKLNILKGEIKFNKTSFAYKSGKPIFKDLELKISSGEKVGIIGTSGAGKTTITKLLLRFADVTGGSITIDGQDIRNITQDDLRSVVSYVPQDPILFHRTLRENIAYGKPDATEEEIIEASKEAHCHEFISGLEYGYDTLVGERGIKLSGGERQRVAIARAILKNAPVLILDEATSSLDSVSETHIKEALDRLMQGKTTIVIAHRLSTIEKMDRIIVLEKGEIIEEGNHKELLAKKGTYFNFWNHQNRGFIE